MRIYVKPSDLIERCIWDEYYRFKLKSKVKKEEIKKIIEDDKEFEINEDDAFVIRLLNCVYTPYLSYKLNQLLKSDLINKSVFVEKEKRYYINKYNLEDTVNNFLKKIPQNYKSENIIFNKELEKLPDLINIFIYNVDQLESIDYNHMPMVKIKQVKKIINEVFK